MRIPAWLDPFWRIEYETESPMSTDDAGAALRPRKGRLRGRPSGHGVTLVYRRGGLMNGFARARVTVSPLRRGSKIQVQISRPAIATGFFVFALIFMVVIPFLDMLQVVAFYRPRLPQAIVYSLLGAVLWLFLIGINYTSARSEARDLRRLISQALRVSK